MQKNRRERPTKSTGERDRVMSAFCQSHLPKFPLNEHFLSLKLLPSLLLLFVAYCYSFLKSSQSPSLQHSDILTEDKYPTHTGLPISYFPCAPTSHHFSGVSPVSVHRHQSNALGRLGSPPPQASGVNRHHDSRFGEQPLCASATRSAAAPEDLTPACAGCGTTDFLALRQISCSGLIVGHIVANRPSFLCPVQ